MSRSKWHTWETIAEEGHYWFRWWGIKGAPWDVVHIYRDLFDENLVGSLGVQSHPLGKFTGAFWGPIETPPEPDIDEFEMLRARNSRMRELIIDAHARLETDRPAEAKGLLSQFIATLETGKPQ